MKQNSLFILGRQPLIGIAELESLYSNTKLQAINDFCVLSDISHIEVDFNRLGSTVKLAEILYQSLISNEKEIEKNILSVALSCAQEINEGKIQIGLSFYNFQLSINEILKTGFKVKSILRNHNYSVRLIPNQNSSLNSAQVIHNKLTGDKGIELIITCSNDHYFISRTKLVQDISSYSKRDYDRPKKDAYVGMLPPKLAQTIINLASSNIPAKSSNVILDPFCGTGVLLQEALLMGFGAYGSDIDNRMVDYSRKNLEWLESSYNDKFDVQIDLGDATNYEWKNPFIAVASELYLGHPLSSWPSTENLQSLISSCNVITRKFLLNIAKQTSAGQRFCIAIPAWINPSSGQIYHLPLIDQLSKLGYNRVSFSLVSDKDLVYHRPNQIVGRELLVITRI